MQLAQDIPDRMCPGAEEPRLCALLGGASDSGRDGETNPASRWSGDQGIIAGVGGDRAWAWPA
jgi:hypothetical protein